MQQRTKNNEYVKDAEYRMEYKKKGHRYWSKKGEKRCIELSLFADDLTIYIRTRNQWVATRITMSIVKKMKNQIVQRNKQ